MILFSPLNRNLADPSITNDYSILGEGDTIKAITVSPHFLYRLEAGERGTNGGIFVAPQNYRFVCFYDVSNGFKSLVKCAIV